MIGRLAVLVLAASAISSSAFGADQWLTSADGMVSFRGSYGITAIEANEFVFDGRRKVSQLIWQSSYVSTFSGDIKVDLDRFFVKASATIGTGGDGHMRNYDWLAEGRRWSDRSVHTDTRLNHYFVGSIEAGRVVLDRNGTAVSLGGGIKYTDVKWAAWGGSYVYSGLGFRDDRGNFPDNARGISYRQQWPVPFLGFDITHADGPWRFSSGFRGGMALGGQGTDDHWMRGLRFVDRIEATPAMMLSAAVAYELRPDTAFVVSGAYDRIFKSRADTDMIDTATGDRTRFDDGAGAGYHSMSISLGLKGRF